MSWVGIVQGEVVQEKIIQVGIVGGGEGELSGHTRRNTSEFMSILAFVNSI